MKHLQHLTAMILVSIIMGLIYVSVQQVYRMNANDPQIQLARDLRDAVERNVSMPAVSNIDTVTLERSMALFRQSYDADGRPLTSTALLNGRVPVLPKGALEHAAIRGENDITWQPEHGVRLATVIVSVQHPTTKYVAVGRSLQAVEERETNLRITVMLCWIICIAIIGINWLVYIYFGKKNQLV